MIILIADDNEQNIYQLQFLLGSNGYQIITAANGAEALAKARQTPPDLIVSDILMPVMDGFTLCREWKKDKRLRLIPFIFYTATYTDNRDKEFALSLGADKFIVKPEEPEVLMQIVRDVIQQAKQGPVVSPCLPKEPTESYLQQYNEVLIRKLESKMAQLEEVNRKLENDIVERKKTDEALWQSEVKFRKILEKVPLPLVYVTKDGVIDFMNERFVRVLGYTSEDVRTLSDWWPRAYPDPKYRQGTIVKWSAAVQNAINSGNDIESGEYRVTCKNGEEKIVNISGIMIGEELLAMLIDLTERKREEELLKESERRLSEAQKMAQLGSWKWDIKTGNVEWSEEVFRIFRRDPAKFVPNIDSILELSPWPEDHNRGKELIQRAMDSHEKGEYEQRFIRPDNSIGYYFSTFQGKYDEDGNLVVMIGTVQDITERKQTEEKLKEAKKTLEQINAAKTDFLMNVSHDIRTPMNVINGFTSILMGTSLNKEQEKYCVLIKDKVGDLLRLLEDVIDISIVEKGKVVIRQSPFDMRALAEDIKKTAEMQIGGKDIKFKCDVAESVPWELLGDQLRLKQILENLCGNAVKYTVKGEITLLISAYNTVMEDGARLIHFSVSDTGRGIMDNHVPHIFEPYTRFYEPGQKMDGVGLGLHIVKTLVSAMGGEVAVKSEMGKGSKFSFDLKMKDMSTGK
ncbi:MAG TPA: ATP-binding protein [Candidatus Omnitrophota bacterium]|nr:ATP-binding protein [Candidatus Omnitrophota bacterium]